MKKMKTLLVALMSTVLLCSCSPDNDHGVVISGRSNADVTFTNERTNEKWHGSSDGIEQSVSITIGDNDEDNSFDLTAKAGDVIRVNYSPYSHFADKHSVSMTILFDGVNIVTLTGAPYEAEFTVDASMGIHTLTVVGTSGKDGDDCYLNERRTIRVKVE